MKFLKLHYRDSIKKIKFVGEGPTWDDITKMLMKGFNMSEKNNIFMTYKDFENDEISVCGDDDLAAAYNLFSNENSIRFDVKYNGKFEIIKESTKVCFESLREGKHSSSKRIRFSDEDLEGLFSKLFAKERSLEDELRTLLRVKTENSELPDGPASFEFSFNAETLCSHIKALLLSELERLSSADKKAQTHEIQNEEEILLKKPEIIEELVVQVDPENSLNQNENIEKEHQSVCLNQSEYGDQEEEASDNKHLLLLEESAKKNLERSKKLDFIASIDEASFVDSTYELITSRLEDFDGLENLNLKRSATQNLGKLEYKDSIKEGGYGISQISFDMIEESSRLKSRFINNQKEFVEKKIKHVNHGLDDDLPAPYINDYKNFVKNDI